MSLLNDWSFWGTIAGIAATVVFGIWAVALAKSRKYPGEITFFRERPIRLLDDVIGNLPQITVSYKGQPAAKNLSLLKGFLLNTGRKDISKDMIEQPLTLQLEEGCRWLEASGKGSWDNAEHAAIIDPRTVAFPWTMLRCNEFLHFEALVEIGGAKVLRPKITTQHRIADTGKVRVEGLPLKPKKDLKDKASPLIAMSVGFGVVVGSLVYGKGPVNSFLLGLGLALFTFSVFALILVHVLTRKQQRIRKLLQLD